MRYSICGITIKSNVSFKNLDAYCLSGMGIDDASMLISLCVCNQLPGIELKRVLWDQDDFAVYCNDKGFYGFFSLAAKKMCAILSFSKDNSVKVFMPKSLSEPASLEILTKRILPLISYKLASALSVHATVIKKNEKCIALCGASHAGKSTLAAYLILCAGYELVTDDIVMLYPKDGEAFFFTAPSRLRLRKKSICYFREICEYNDEDIKAIDKVAAYSLKTLFYLDTFFAEGDDISPEFISQENAFDIVVKSLYAPYLSENASDTIKNAIKISSCLKAISVRYNKKFNSLSHICDYIDFYTSGS